MSIPLYKNVTNCLRFYDEEEILLRKQIVETVTFNLKRTLKNMNPAWSFHQCDAPVLLPENFVAREYKDNEDVFKLSGTRFGGKKMFLRPETTAGSYLYLQHLLTANSNYKKIKLPVCVWQAGKSFRTESNDGASATKLRFNEFYQLEFQCCFSKSTKAEYLLPIVKTIRESLRAKIGAHVRVVYSDRTPKYAHTTTDIEVHYGNRWVELCSISERKDSIIPNSKVIEVAIGLDRVTTVCTGENVQ